MDSRRTECEEIVRRLWPFLDEMLVDSDRERVTRHLEQCHDCLSHFDFAKAFLDAVHAARPDETDGEALRARVMAGLIDHGLKL